MVVVAVTVTVEAVDEGVFLRNERRFVVGWKLEAYHNWKDFQRWPFGV